MFLCFVRRTYTYNNIQQHTTYILYIYKTDKLKKQSDQNSRPASQLHFLKKWSEFGIWNLQVAGWRLEGRLLHNNNNFLSILYAFIHLRFLFLKTVTLDRTTSV